MERFTRAGLYLVTSQSLSAGRTTVEIVRAALAAGVRLVQLREKDLPLREFMRLAETVRDMTKKADALLIVNDRLDVALGVGADGVHLGLDDLPVPTARRLAPDLIIGASSHSATEARLAQQEGASYVNIGPLFPTRTKHWSGAFLGVDGLRNIAPAVTIPFTVMGGIKLEHVPELIAAGARTIAVVSAVTTAPDPERAAREMVAAIRKGSER
jgi:thiamine-phosphate pyrophosphorylase